MTENQLTHKLADALRKSLGREVAKLNKEQAPTNSAAE